MITKTTKLWRYISSLFISIDQLGNVLAGGNADNTISARVGYYNNHYAFESGTPWYWRLLQSIINAAFYPVDGPNHCHEAYHNDAGEVFDNRVTNFFIAIAATFFIIPSCIVIALILYILWGLRIVKPKTIKRDENLIKRFKSCCRILRGAQQEIHHYGTDFDLEGVKKQLAELSKKVEEIEDTLR